MGLTDLASSIIDKATSSLAGDGDAPRPEKQTPEFVKADPLDPPNPDDGINAGPNSGDTDPNPKNTPPMLEFVHFGKYHADPGNHYSHDSYDNEPGQKPLGRAILFRDAVERESVLLLGFITSAQTVHTELKKNRGPAGDIAGAIGKLTGGGGGAKEPDPASFKFLLDDITTAGETINKEPIDYVPVHKAGIDLHQTRTDYRAFCKDKLEPFYLNPPDGGPASLIPLPAVAGASKTVFDILFKAFDIYLGMFLALRDTYEPEIENACYKFSIDVVKNYKPHTYAPWYPAPKKPEEKKKDDAPTDDIGKTVKKVTDTVSSTIADVVDVLGKPAPGEKPPGETTINNIFAIFGSSSEKDKDKAPPPPPKPGDLPDVKAADAVVTAAFASVLHKDSLGFLDKIIGKVVWANVEFLRAVYLRLLKNGPNQIDQKWLNETAHTLLMNKLYAILYDNLSFLNTIHDASAQGLGPGKLIDKQQDALTQKIGPLADSVITLATGKLAEVLENLRFAASGIPKRKDSDGKDLKTMTMEVYLGALPYLLALQVRNTIFPVWELLVTDMLGKGNAALSTALKPVKNMIGDVRDMANSVKTMHDRLDKIYDATKTDSGNQVSQNTNFGRLANIAKGGEDAIAPKADTSKGGNFPGGVRITKGNGNPVTEDNAQAAKKDRKGKGWPS